MLAIEEINLENSVNNAQEWLSKMNVNEIEKVKQRRIRSYVRAAKKLRELEQADRKLSRDFSCAYDRNKSIHKMEKAHTAVCRTWDAATRAGAKAWELVF